MVACGYRRCQQVFTLNILSPAGAHVQLVATFTSFTPVAVLSESAAPVTIANEIPVENRIPFDPPSIVTVEVAGIAITKTGTLVPTVGAVARL